MVTQDVIDYFVLNGTQNQAGNYFIGNYTSEIWTGGVNCLVYRNGTDRFINNIDTFPFFELNITTVQEVIAYIESNQLTYDKNDI